MGKYGYEFLFADRVRSIRDALEWSAQRLADRCKAEGEDGLTRVAISKIENHSRAVTLNEAVTLCRVFGVSLDRMISTDPFTFEIRTEVKL